MQHVVTELSTKDTRRVGIGWTQEMSPRATSELTCQLRQLQT